MRDLIKLGIVAIMLPWAAPVAAGTLAGDAAAIDHREYPSNTELWRPSADRDDPSAQHNLGVVYAGGDGVRQDDAEALKWFRKSAEQGYAPAQYSLGHMYLEGAGVSQDLARATAYFGKAAEQGYLKAQYELAILLFQGQGVTEDYIAAYKWLEIVASKGNTLASEKREVVAMKMTPVEIAIARKQAKDWQRK